MSRFKTEIQLNKSEEFVNFITNDFFNKEGFEYKEIKGETAWKYGNGLLTCPQFIKISYQNGTLTIEAWLKFALLPGVYAGEMGLKGFVGAIPKSALKSKIDQLIYLLNQEIPTDAVKNNTNDTKQPIPVYTHDTSKNATTALILGLCSFIGILIPIGGILLGGFGIGSGKKALNSKSKGLATGGIIISIIGIVASVLSWILKIIIYTAS